MRLKGALAGGVILIACAGGASAQEGNRPVSIGERLVGTLWQVESIDGVPVDAVDAPTMEVLPDGHVRGKAGCNRYVATVASRADRVVFGPASTTRVLCGEPQDGLERRFLDALRRGERIMLDGDRMVLETHSADEPTVFLRANE